MDIDWEVVLTTVFSDVLSTTITAGVGFLIIQNLVSKLSFADKLRSYGFSSVGVSRQSKSEVKDMCKNATLIKIINVSGFHYLNTNELFLKEALSSGIEIRFLCADKDSVFLTDIEEMENDYFGLDGLPVRDINSKIKPEIESLVEKYPETNLKIKYYNTEYRLPFVLAYYPNGDIKAWLTLTLPPYKSTKSIVLRGLKKEAEGYNEDISFIDMMETNFDSVWEHSQRAINREREY